jgi:hypothetical protein
MSLNREKGTKAAKATTPKKEQEGLFWSFRRFRKVDAGL